jgi:Skp family chaperone for outer membrane proteins
VAAKEGSYKAEATRPAPHAGAAGGRTETNARTEANAGGHTAVHPNELPAAEKHAAPNTGNAKLDQKYQQQQQKLETQQAQERQKLQAQQEKEHQQIARQNADEARKAQVEQKHQQQTQQMVQRHTQQQQNLQQKQQPHASAPKGKH